MLFSALLMFLINRQETGMRGVNEGRFPHPFLGLSKLQLHAHLLQELPEFPYQVRLEADALLGEGEPLVPGYNFPYVHEVRSLPVDQTHLDACVHTFLESTDNAFLCDRSVLGHVSSPRLEFPVR